MEEIEMDQDTADRRTATTAETFDARVLYASSNGDRWLLVREHGAGRVFVRHEPNRASGGRAAMLEIGDFLSRGGHGPEHQALLHLIGTLVGDGMGAEAQPAG
jgi:hypothetical protein